MTRINIYARTEDGRSVLEGWFDPERCERFDEGTCWDGNNNIGVISRADVRFVDEALYRTPGGRWVRNSDRTRYHGGPDVYEFLSDDEARDWLLRSEINDEVVEQHWGELAAESGPGRPSLGDGQVITIKFPEGLLAQMSAAAETVGIPRTEWVRQACAAMLEGVESR